MKSAYRALQSLDWNDVDGLWRHVWKLLAAQRVRTFLWLMFKGRLLPNAECFRGMMTNDQQCSLCNSPTEDINHVLKECPFAAQVWKKVLPLPSDIYADLYRKNALSLMSDNLPSPLLDISWKLGLSIFNGETITVDTFLIHIRDTVDHTLGIFPTFKILM